MLKTIVLIGLTAALALPSAAALAVSGDSSAYGTQDYGPTVPTQSLTPFQRSWNHANESKERARAGASWLRHHALSAQPGSLSRPADRRPRIFAALRCYTGRAFDERSDGSMKTARVKRTRPMFKATSFVGLAAVLALMSSAAFAEQGNSSSWGSYGWGPVIPTQSLTPRDRQYNFDNQALYEAGRQRRMASPTWERAVSLLQQVTGLPSC